MTCFVGPLVVLDRSTHARLIADVVRARAELVEMQARALTGERKLREAERQFRRAEMAAAALEHVNEEMRAQIRVDEQLLGFGVEG